MKRPRRISSALWRELAHETPDARAVMSNLVIFRERAEAEDVDVEAPLRDGLVVEVARCHPSRVVLLVHARSDLECRTPLPAAVGILTFGPAEARHAVEQIAVRSQGLEQSLPSIVRRLVLGDLPTSVWWTEDLSQTPPLAELATMGRQFVYDSRQWRDVRAGISTVAGLLEHPHAPDLADLNWRRLAPLRQAVSRGLAAAGRGPAGRDGAPVLRDAPGLAIQLQHAPGEEALACLMIGWLTSRLERPSGPELTVTVSQDAGTDHRLAISIGAADSRRHHGDDERAPGRGHVAVRPGSLLDGGADGAGSRRRRRRIVDGSAAMSAWSTRCAPRTRGSLPNAYVVSGFSRTVITVRLKAGSCRR